MGGLVAVMPDGQRRTMTVSRYSLGTTIVPSSARLNRRDELDDVGLERAAPGLADRLERLEGRAVVPPPVVDERLGRALAEDVVRFARAELGDRRRRTARAAGPRCPTGSASARPAGGGTCRAIDLEQLADEARRACGHEADPAAGAGDARELGRGPLLVRREHRAEDRAHDVEAGVRERERLGVALDGTRLTPSASARRRARSSSDGT